MCQFRLKGEVGTISRGILPRGGGGGWGTLIFVGFGALCHSQQLCSYRMIELT